MWGFSHTSTNGENITQWICHRNASFWIPWGASQQLIDISSKLRRYPGWCRKSWNEILGRRHRALKKAVQLACLLPDHIMLAEQTEAATNIGFCGSFEEQAQKGLQGCGALLLIMHAACCRMWFPPPFSFLWLAARYDFPSHRSLNAL